MQAPGMQLRGGARPTTVRCSCGVTLTTLAAGERIVAAARALQAREIELTCVGCGKPTTLHVEADRAS
jgi:hypothetical protein